MVKPPKLTFQDPEDIRQDPRTLQWASLLQRAHEMLQANDKLTIGQAVKRVISAADVEVPEDIENTMVRALGKLLLQGFPSKVDA